MQVLYLKAGVIAKGKGAGLHAAAAYRAGESLRESIPGDTPSLAGKMAYDSGSVMSDGAQEKLHDYRRKEHVVTTFINAPEGAPEWAGELQSLCDAITAEETRKNARLMRKFEISLARGLSEEEQAAVCKRWCDEHFTQHGVISVVSLHNSKASDGEDNPHAHILAATRTLDADGWHENKNNIRWMNSKETLRQWRTSMGEYTNEALQAAGVDRPVTYHSYASMGVEQEVTRPLGPKAHRQEQHGITTKQGDENRRILAERALRDELHRLKQAGGGDDGRQAWFDSFSYQFGESMDAKRDVIHRFRAKDAERRNVLSDDKQGKETPEMTQARATFNSLNESARQGVQQVRDSEQAQGVQRASEQAYNHVPNAKQPEPNQRGLGLSKEGTAPPPPSPEAARMDSAMTASMQQGQQQGTQQNATNLQQKQFTLGTPTDDRNTSIAHQYGAPKEHDTNMAVEKLKQQNSGRDDR